MLQNKPISANTNPKEIVFGVGDPLAMEICYQLSKKKIRFRLLWKRRPYWIWWHKWEALSHLIYQQIQFILGIQTDKTTTKLLVRGIFDICFSFCFMTLSIWAIAKWWKKIKNIVFQDHRFKTKAYIKNSSYQKLDKYVFNILWKFHWNRVRNRAEQRFPM